MKVPDIDRQDLLIYNLEKFVFLEIFVNYRDLDTDSGIVDITSKGYTAGVKVRF